MFRFFLVASLASIAFSEMTSVGGLCPSTFTPVAGICCPDSQVVDSCVDKINPNTGTSDCPKMAAYCSNPAYKSIMADQCKKTCGLCSGCSGPTGTICKDEVNPTSGLSDCPQMVTYCKHPVYKELMEKQCRKTCGLC